MKDVLITAGTRNTGLCIAQAFAARGWRVHLSSREETRAVETARLLEEKYPACRAFGYALDLGDVGSIRAAFAQIGENAGRLDVFVANAGNLGIGADLFTADEALFDEIVGANVRGTFFCCREAARLMKEGGGSIVLMSSVQSKGYVEGRTLYGMSKAAIDAMNKYLAYDLAPYGIRTNCLVAGAIHTDRWEISAEELARRRRDYPTGRETDMADVAEAVLFLAGDAAKTMTGTELVMDSGRLAGLLPYRDKKLFQREGF